MDKVIENIAIEILEVCGDDDEVSALIDNVLLYIAELVEDDEWQPTPKDLKQIFLDNKDDEDETLSADDEDVEVICDDNGFMSLR